MSEVQVKKTLGLAIASFVLGCFFIIPLLGSFLGLIAIILGVIALVKISNNREMFKGNGLAISGIVMGAISIVIIPIIALLAAIAIPNLLRARITANDAYAKAAVSTLSTALITYATANSGEYPVSELELTLSNPPYITNTIDNKDENGYKFSVSITKNSFKIIAQPQQCMNTGTKVITSSNGEVSEKNCQ